MIYNRDDWRTAHDAFVYTNVLLSRLNHFVPACLTPGLTASCSQVVRSYANKIKIILDRSHGHSWMLFNIYI